MARRDDECHPVRIAPWDGVEPIADWHRFVRRAQGLLNVAAALHAGTPAQTAHWRRAFEGWREEGVSIDGTRQPVPWWKRSVAADRRVLVDLVNDWLRLGGATPLFRWRGDTPLMVFGISSLAGAVALQLALAVARSEGLVICSNCARAFSPVRRPAADRRRYCQQCRTRGIPLRDAQRAHRTRNRDGHYS